MNIYSLVTNLLLLPVHAQAAAQQLRSSSPPTGRTTAYILLLARATGTTQPVVLRKCDEMEGKQSYTLI
jgi:hypothetical protein